MASAKSTNVGSRGKFVVLTGAIDRFDHYLLDGWFISGWAVDTDSLERSLDIEVVENGAVAAAATADIERLDLEYEGRHGKRHGFRAPIATRDAGPVELQLRLAKTHRTISEAVLQFDPIIGFLDSVADGWVSGWAVDTADPSHRVVVDVEINGRLAGCTRADHFRSDLAGAWDGSQGFTWPIPEILYEGDPVVDVSANRGIRACPRARLKGGPLPLQKRRWTASAGAMRDTIPSVDILIDK